MDPISFLTGLFLGLIIGFLGAVVFLVWAINNG